MEGLLLSDTDRRIILDQVDSQLRHWRKSQGVFASMQVTMRFSSRIGDVEKSEEITVKYLG